MSVLVAVNLNITFEEFTKKYGGSYPIGILPTAPKKITLSKAVKEAGAVCSIMFNDKRLMKELEENKDLHSVTTTVEFSLPYYPKLVLLKSESDALGIKIRNEYYHHSLLLESIPTGETVFANKFFKEHKTRFTKLYSDLKKQPIFNTFATNV